MCIYNGFSIQKNLAYSISNPIQTSNQQTKKRWQKDQHRPESSF